MLITLFFYSNVNTTFAISDIALENVQLQDWVCLGNILRTISSAAKFRDNDARCSIIDRLASKLESLIDVYVLNHILWILRHHFLFTDPFPLCVVPVFQG